MERYRFDAYGEVTVLDADHSSDADGASDVENPHLYTGRRLDSESGLMQYRHRYYSTGLGRFVSRDPAGYVDGQCFYEFGQSRPVMFADPFGTWSWCPKMTKFTFFGVKFAAPRTIKKKWKTKCLVCKKCVWKRNLNWREVFDEAQKQGVAIRIYKIGRIERDSLAFRYHRVAKRCRKKKRPLWGLWPF